MFPDKDLRYMLLKISFALSYLIFFSGNNFDHLILNKTILILLSFFIACIRVLFPNKIISINHVLRVI